MIWIRFVGYTNQVTHINKRILPILDKIIAELQNFPHHHPPG